MSEEALTFSELRKIQKTERRQEQLSELDQKFFLNVRDYLESKKKVDEGSREYKNARRVFRKILSLREDKIVKNARLSLKSNIRASELDLLPREEEFFREVKQKFNAHRDRIEEVIDGDSVGRADDGKDSDDVSEVEEEAEEEIEKDSGNKEPSSEAEDGYEVVKVTSEVPEFMGTDLEAYGPFEEGDEAEIPEDNAEILVNRGNAEKMS